VSHFTYRAICLTSSNQLGSKRDMLEIELNESLRRRREELRARLDGIAAGSSTSGPSGAEDGPADLESRSRELKALEASVEELQSKLKGQSGSTLDGVWPFYSLHHADADESLETVARELQEKTAELETAQTTSAEDSRSIARAQKHADRYLAKRAMLVGRRDEVNRSIRDLGVLPEEAFQERTEKTDRVSQMPFCSPIQYAQYLLQLVKKLHAVNEGLKKFAHVNKKAFEQYGSFTKQRDALLKRREDLDGSASSIEELIETLDRRKDEAIDRTFRQVAKNFEEVFEQLVPAGRGRLIIQRKVDQVSRLAGGVCVTYVLTSHQNVEEEEEDDDTQQSSVDNYTGVSIKVSFNSKVDEGLRIQQLSGGQKSLVALATGEFHMHILRHCLLTNSIDSVRYPEM